MLRVVTSTYGRIHISKEFLISGLQVRVLPGSQTVFDLGSPDQANDHQQDYRPDGGVDDPGDVPAADQDAELGQHEDADEGADDADDDVADQTEADRHRGTTVIDRDHHGDFRHDLSDDESDT